MITIRKAELSDIPFIRKVAGETWYVTYAGIMSQEQSDYMFEMMYSADSLTQQISGGHTFFLAFEDENMLGYVSVERESENLFHLHKIYVNPSAHGKGIGRLLIEKAFEFAKTEASGNPCSIELNVNRDNKARYFYEKMGMAIDRQRDFPIGNGFFMYDYIMKKEL